MINLKTYAHLPAPDPSEEKKIRKSIVPKVWSELQHGRSYEFLRMLLAMQQPSVLVARWANGRFGSPNNQRLPCILMMSGDRRKWERSWVATMFIAGVSYCNGDDGPENLILYVRLLRVMLGRDYYPLLNKFSTWINPLLILSKQKVPEFQGMY